MLQVANDNTHTATGGQCFHPEMGERHDGTALFVSQIGYKGYYLKWAPERHQEALAAFKALRVRPRHMEAFTTVKGAHKWSCSVTWDAGRKIIDAKYAVLEMLLD